jgi:hypothetical protein
MAFAQKEEEAAIAIPPQPVPVEVKVERGEEASIPLRIYGRRIHTLTFVIRKLPRSGKLSAPKNLTSDSAVIRYRPPEERSVMRDEFEYAVKSSEGVSASVPVKIEIVDRPAELIVPPEITFLQRLTGTREVQTVEIQNRGGLPAEGEAIVEAPWQIDGEAKYRVEPGKRTVLRLGFAPEKAGAFLAELRFSSHPDRITVLRGLAVDAIGVKPDVITLSTDPKVDGRVAVFEVTNHSGEPQVIRIQTPERLVSDKEIRLDPEQSRAVTVHTISGDTTELAGEIALEAGSYKAKVKVRGDSLPAMIRPVEATMDFGPVASGVVSTSEITLENAGGMPGQARLTVGPPFRIDPAQITLGPREKAKAIVQVLSGTIGTAEAQIEIQGAGETVRLPVRAVVTHAGSSVLTAKARRHKSSEAEKSKSTSAESRGTEAEPRESFSSQIPGAVAAWMVLPIKLDPKSCVIEWDKKLSDSTKFRAEVRELSLVEKQLSINWRHHPGFRTERGEKAVRGFIDQLEPGQTYAMRVLPLLKSGKYGEAFVQTSFRTPLPEKKGWRFNWRYALGFVAAALIAFTVRARLKAS